MMMLSRLRRKKKEIQQQASNKSNNNNDNNNSSRNKYNRNYQNFASCVSSLRRSSVDLLTKHGKLRQCYLNSIANEKEISVMSFEQVTNEVKRIFDNLNSKLVI